VCSKTCGTGQKTRTRTKNGPFHGGAACHGHTSHTTGCNTQGCPANCYFQAWSAWGACTKTCIAEGNYGYKTRTRGKVGPFFGGKACHGHTTDDGLCNTFTCPYDCKVQMWGTWTVCTQTCSVSVRTHGYKTRSRTSVAASNGGKMCAANWQMSHCNTQLCAFDCYFLPWGAWGPCSTTCTLPNQKSGMRIRVRDKVGPGQGGKACSGPVTSTKSCNDFTCPQDCVWGEWAKFGTCSKTCGSGGKSRERKKTPAKNGGKDCVGPTMNTEPCNTWRCPVNCRWSLWDAWMPCTRTCGMGFSHRSRSYDPKPSNGGGHCAGAHMEMIDCNGMKCPVDCVFEQWMDWGMCSKSCGGGARTRVRLVNITEGHGGMPCQDDPSQEEECPDKRPCPMDCRFAKWGNWTDCNSTCGPGHKHSERVLLEAENGGVENCPEGELKKADNCESEACPEAVKASAPPSLGFLAYSFVWVAVFLAQA